MDFGDGTAPFLAGGVFLPAGGLGLSALRVLIEREKGRRFKESRWWCSGDRRIRVLLCRSGEGEKKELVSNGDGEDEYTSNNKQRYHF